MDESIIINSLQERIENGERRAVIAGEVVAHCGRYAEAARMFHSAGRDDRALALYLDLRMFNKAQVIVILYISRTQKEIYCSKSGAGYIPAR